MCAERATRVLRAMDEAQNFVAEQKRLMAEAATLHRNREFAPRQVALARMAAGAAFFGPGAACMKLLGP